MSNSLPAVVRKGNFDRKIEPCALGSEGLDGKRRERALGRRRKLGQVRSVGIPHRVNILLSWSTSFLPSARGDRVSISPNIQPTLHMSTSVL